MSRRVTFFGCELPPGWLIIDGISRKNTSIFLNTLPQLDVASRDQGLELDAIFGNDLQIDVTQYAESQMEKGNFLFIGATFLRPLLLCLQLATNTINPTTTLPRLMIIDRSHFIISCWKFLKENPDKILAGDYSDLVSLTVSHRYEHRESNTQYAEFSDNELSIGLTRTLNTSLLEIRKFDLFLIKAILEYAIIICADWENTTVFEKIQALCEENRISNLVLYPSNIIECAYKDPSAQIKILRNIQLLHPVLAIHILANLKSSIPSETLFVHSSTSADDVLKAINRFSITRTHENKPMPEKMTEKDRVLGDFDSTIRLLGSKKW